MPKSMTLSLAFPPTVNTYWRAARGRVILSAKGREYRDLVAWAIKVAEQQGSLPDKDDRPGLSSRLSVSVGVHCPDRRHRDLDNILKSLLDSLQHAGVYHSDSQIDELHVKRMSRVEGGQVMVAITELGPEGASKNTGVMDGIRNGYAD